ncbi:MAG: 3-hydroxyisobutyrate dehydrogenase [Coriobacteriales bacterium]
MEKNLLDYTAGKVDEMLVAGSAAPETKKAAQDWKDAIAAGKDANEATNKLLDSISEHQTTVDSMLAFLNTETAKKIMGEDGVAQMVKHETARKDAGARFCDCAACKPCHELLTKFGREEADVYL